MIDYNEPAEYIYFRWLLSEISEMYNWTQKKIELELKS